MFCISSIIKFKLGKNSKWDYPFSSTMSWAEEQDWFGLEDLILEGPGLVDIEDLIPDLDTLDPKQLLLKYDIWLTAKREKINIKQMTDRHIVNCINMIEEGRLKREYALPILLNELERRNSSNKYDY